MILIINQHKGDLAELVDHLNNYDQVRVSTKFWMTLCIDQVVSDEDHRMLIKLEDEIDGLTLIFNGDNIGLSGSRVNSIDATPRFIKERCSNESSCILFGCTNSKFEMLLTDKLHDQLVDVKHVTLIPCNYKNQIQMVDKSMLSNKYISLSDYISNLNRPDFTIMIPWECRHSVMSIIGEKYLPEELIIADSCDILNSRNLRIFQHKLQLAWYNPTGLSANFSRKFVHENKEGFSIRAASLLGLYAEGKLNLSHDALKGLMYDFVTLGNQPGALKSEHLRSYYYFVLKHWVDSKDHEHLIKFEEDVK